MRLFDSELALMELVAPEGLVDELFVVTVGIFPFSPEPLAPVRVNYSLTN